MAVSTIQADLARPPLHVGVRLRGDHQDRAREDAAGAAAQERRPQQQRPHHHPPPGRRPQAALSDHRLQAQQGRRARQGALDRVRPQPLGPDRAAALCRRREALHPGAHPPDRRRDRRVGRRRRHPARQRAAAGRRSRPAPPSTTSSCGPDRAARWCARPAARRSWSPRRAGWRCCGCPPARCAACRSPAARPSASSATRRTRTSPAARPGRSRWKGKRPTVRGTVMNPVDHPHGGGEGKNKGSHPVTPWGKPTLGYRTRNKKKASTQDIVAFAQEREGFAMSRSSKKGPFVDPKLMKRVEEMNETQAEADAEDLVAHLHDLPRVRRPHDRRSRRAQARARVRVGVDGRPQAGRVRAHPHLSRAWK